jgi:DNA-binding transcriptional LysR family regulator
MNITLKQLRVFCAVYEHRNFTSAAESMHMTQSAVSKLCAEVENEVGLPLFERTTRRVVPCDGAADLYAHAQDILGTMRTAERSLSSLKRLERGSVSFASSPMMMYGLSRPVIAAFHGSHPAVSLDLHELSTDETIEFVRTGRVDFGLVSIPEGDALLQARVIHRSPISVICHPDHPLAGRASVRWAELARHPLISLRSVYSVRRTVDRILSARGLELRSSIQAGTLASALGLVASGLGITLAPGYASTFARQLGLCVVAISGAARDPHEISLLTRRDSRPSIAAAAFIAGLEAHLASGKP